MAQRRTWSSLVLFVVLLLFLLASIVAVIAGLWIVASKGAISQASPRLSPLAGIKAGALSSTIALQTLAGCPDEEVAEQAIAAGSSETALATLLYGTSLNDQARTAGLLSLARSLSQARKNDRAALAAGLAVDLAILSPTMPDYNRATVLDHAGLMLASVGKKDDAAHAYSVASTIAQASGALDPSYRQLLLETLAQDMSRLGRNDLAHRARQAVQNVPPPLETNPAALATLSLPLSAGDTPAWASLTAASTERARSADALIAALDTHASTSVETQRQALEKALTEEDSWRDQVYAEGLAAGDNLLLRVAYARARVEWLALKWRVARQGFGLSLVPAWERQVSDIEATVTSAIEEYYTLMRDAAVSSPDLVEAAQGAASIVRDQIKMSRLGFPLATPDEQLLRTLEKANADRIALGGVNSIVATTNEEGNVRLTVVSIWQ